MGRGGRNRSITRHSNYSVFLSQFQKRLKSRGSSMGSVTAKVMTADKRLALEALPYMSTVTLPDGFVPATKAQVAYWSELCSAIRERASRGMGDADWNPE